MGHVDAGQVIYDRPGDVSIWRARERKRKRPAFEMMMMIIIIIPVALAQLPAGQGDTIARSSFNR